jgi:hypothetical protein
MRRLLALVAVVLFAAATHHARAESPDFVLVNSTGYSISEVYLSRPKSNSWGNDVMGKGSLEDGNGVNITFNTDACVWDLKVVYEEDDSTAVWNNVNLCRISKLKLFWDSAAEKTWAVPE